MHVNRQLGNYVIVSQEENRGPFYVRMAGAEDAPDNLLSAHANVTSAVKSILRYQTADKRRAGGG